MRRLRSVFILFLTVGLIAAFVYYLYVNSEKYIELLQISPLPVLLIMIATALSLLTSGIVNISLVRCLDAELSPRDAFFLTAASTLANQLPISGGIITKAYYLKRKHNLSYAKFFSANLALFFCFICVNGFIGIAILLYWVIFESTAVSPALLSAFAIMAVGILVLWLPFGQIRIPAGIRKWLSQALDGWTLISKNPILVSKFVGLQTILVLLLALRYWLAFRMLSQDVSLGDTVLFSAASVLTQLASIAPGGLGVTEAIVGGVASLLGFDWGVSVVAVGLDRLISTAVVFVFGGISTVALGKQISES